MDTLLLSTDTWDLTLDSGGNLAAASAPYALAQDAASAARLFLGELWYDTTQGVPYFQNTFGKAPPVSLVTGQVEAAALTVPDVTGAVCVITSLTDRSMSGQLQVTDAQGNTATAGF